MDYGSEVKSLYDKVLYLGTQLDPKDLISIKTTVLDPQVQAAADPSHVLTLVRYAFSADEIEELVRREELPTYVSSENTNDLLHSELAQAVLTRASTISSQDPDGLDLFFTQLQQAENQYSSPDPNPYSAVLLQIKQDHNLEL